jgi:hypothetical protein
MEYTSRFFSKKNYWFIMVYLQFIEKGRTCGIHGVSEKCVQNFGRGKRALSRCRVRWEDDV